MRDCRSDFGIYRNNKELVYLDYAATTFMPDVVIDSWNEYHMNIGVTVNRGSGKLSSKANSIYEASKYKLLNFFGASEQYDIAFTKNATEGLNLLASTMGTFLKPGDYILMSPYEHHSNSIPWKNVAKKYNASIILFPILEDGTLDYEFINKIDIAKIKIISISLISNVNGHKIDMKRIKDITNQSNAKLIIDASQAAGHMILDFETIDASAYVVSAHKMYGPKNIGACFIKKILLEYMPPFLVGGGMVWNVLGGNIEWQHGAKKYEAGTFDIGLVYAWSKACEYLNAINMDKIEEQEKVLWKYIKAQLSTFKSVEIIKGGSASCSICSFDIKKIHPHDLADALAKNNIEIRTGHMCAQGTLEAFGKTSLNRISWGLGSTVADIDKFLEVIRNEV